jgi:hypothetical protein
MHMGINIEERERFANCVMLPEQAQDGSIIN